MNMMHNLEIFTMLFFILSAIIGSVVIISALIYFLDFCWQHKKNILLFTFRICVPLAVGLLWGLTWGRLIWRD